MELSHLMVLTIGVIVTLVIDMLLGCWLSCLAQKKLMDGHVDDINTSRNKHLRKECISLCVDKILVEFET